MPDIVALTERVLLCEATALPNPLLSLLQERSGSVGGDEGRQWEGMKGGRNKQEEWWEKGVLFTRVPNLGILESTS